MLTDVKIKKLNIAVFENDLYISKPIFSSVIMLKTCMILAKHAHGTYLFVGYFRYQNPSSMKIIGNA